jgi:hypothetical protein
MCFSAEASFTSGAIIAAVGVATLNKATKPEQRLFATIPLLFALQQCAEGVVWVTLKSGQSAELQNVAAHVFLVAALVIWPIMVPLSMRLMEKEPIRRGMLAGLMLAGAAVSAYYAVSLSHYTVTPQINGFHVLYANNFPGAFNGLATYFYLPATIFPLFISSVRRMWVFGVIITIACAVSFLFYAQYFTSVWCFFAALISVSIYWILNESRREIPVPVEVMQ